MNILRTHGVEFGLTLSGKQKSECAAQGDREKRMGLHEE